MILTFATYLVKYILLYLYFYLAGKTIIYLIEFFRKDKFNQKYLLFTKVELLYPLIGVIFLSNVLFILNTFVPIKSFFVNIFMFICIIPGLIRTVKNNKFFKETNYINIFNIFCYLIIPSILVVSVYDINFNYDAGYYHLLHQNWLRSSNLVVGMVNIFWPFGMSSIYEYISAFLWFDTSFVLLHFLNLYFIHFFYLFITNNIFYPQNKYLYNTSLFILIYSILDNFGLGGGRNGFIYNQGVTKQDVTIGILFFYTAITILLKIKEKKIKESEIVIISFLILFMYQIKVSGVVVFYLFFILLFFQIKNKEYEFFKIFTLLSPVLILGILWVLKSLFTTGCLIYPVNITCYEGFDWYIKNSTTSFESITKEASLAFDGSIPFLDWISKSGSFEHRNQVFTNFVSSLAILLLLKIFLFKKEKNLINIKLISFSFLILSYLYLIFFGPIPRYAVGVCMITVGLIGIFSGEFKFNISKAFKYSFLLISVLLLVRSTSYMALFNNNDLRLFDPENNYEINIEIGFERISTNWVAPLDRDQCWANIECTASRNDAKLIKKGIFQIAYLDY